MAAPLTIVARIVASSGAADKLETEMKVLVEETRKEPGCILYDLHRGTEDPDIFVFVEAWETKAHWQDHMAGETIKAFNERIGGAIQSGEILQLRQVA